VKVQFVWPGNEGFRILDVALPAIPHKGDLILFEDGESRRVVDVTWEIVSDTLRAVTVHLAGRND
jgi:hypothetical protein